MSMQNAYLGKGLESKKSNKSRQGGSPLKVLNGCFSQPRAASKSELSLFRKNSTMDSHLF